MNLYNAGASAPLHLRSVYCYCIAVLRPFPTIREPKVVEAAVGSSVTLRCEPPSSQPAAVIHWASVGPTHDSPTIIEPTDRIAFDDEGENWTIRISVV